jgi:hypothetical protein
MTKKVSVSKKHIEHGVIKDSHQCMIADAVKEAYPNAQYILVDLQSIRFSDRDKGKRYTYLTPPVAQSALLRFDAGDKAIEPFSFTLTKALVRGMGWQAQNNRTAPNRKGAKKHAKTGKRRPVVSYKEREFGLRQFAR